MEDNAYTPAPGSTMQSARPPSCAPGFQFRLPTTCLFILVCADSGAAAGVPLASEQRRLSEPNTLSSFGVTSPRILRSAAPRAAGGEEGARELSPSEATRAPPRLGLGPGSAAPSLIPAPWAEDWPPVPKASAPVSPRSLTQSSRIRGRLGRQQEGSDGARRHSNSTDSSGVFFEPRIFFLFLTIRGIERMDIWQAFFAGMPPAKFRAMVHCKDKNACKKVFSSKNELGIQLVDTVPSSYCKDLVTPMVQLLKVATAESSTPNDKFLFLSQSTLPVKPFPLLYAELTADRGSDICVSPVPSWVKMRFQAFKSAFLVKHSQWVVLNREHADAMVWNWQRVRVTDDLWSVPIISEGAGHLKHAEIHGDVGICTDEWAFFSTLFGTIIDKGQAAVQHLAGFSGGSLVIHDGGHVSNRWQGVCRTFNFWRVDSPGEQSFLDELLQDMPNTKLSCWPRCDNTHPADFVAISDRGVGVLRRSRFLFARKFQGQVMSLDQFKRIILSSGL